MRSTGTVRLATLALVAALAGAGASVWPGSVQALGLRADGHEPRASAPPADLELRRRDGGGSRRDWSDGHSRRPGWRGWHEPRGWHRHWGWSPRPHPGWWAPAPVWVPSHWEWTAWGWAWVPGHWR